MSNSQQQFDEAQKRKFQKWKAGESTADKQAFDDYVKSVGNLRIIKAKTKSKYTLEYIIDTYAGQKTYTEHNFNTMYGEMPRVGEELILSMLTSDNIPFMIIIKVTFAGGGGVDGDILGMSSGTKAGGTGASSNKVFIGRLTSNISNFSWWQSLCSGQTNNIKKSDIQTKPLPEFNIGDYLILSGTTPDNVKMTVFLKYNNSLSSGNILNVTGMGLATENETSGGGDIQFNLTAHANSIEAGLPATADVQGSDGNFIFNFGIPKGEKGDKGDQGERGPQGPQGPAGTGGGGGSASIDPLPSADDLKSIVGDYGLNLLPYREMTNDTHFKVNGDVFYLDNPKKYANTTEEIEKLTPYNRLYEGISSRHIKISYEAELLESSDKPSGGNNDLCVLIDRNDLGGTPHEVIKLEFPHDNNIIKRHQVEYNDNYSYLFFTMGGKSKPQKGKVRLHAWYGGIKPTGLKQNFFFKQYNGFTLKKNYNGLADEYKIGRWGDRLEMRLGLFKLKEAEVVHVKYDESQAIVSVKAPSDLWHPEDYFNDHPHAGNKATFQKNLMASNLCGIMEADDTSQKQNKPFFIQDIELVEDVNGNEVKVFNILLDKTNRSKWAEHLAETQILYPICDPSSQVTTYLPLGGYKFVLNNRSVIETNKYKKVEKFKNSSIKLSESPFGCADTVITVDNIAEVIVNPHDRLP